MESELSLTYTPQEFNTLSTSWQVNQAAGEPIASISVRNLQSSLQVGRDAWGRVGKLQPVLFSASLSLRAPFEDASSMDTLTVETVNYSTLSKKILEACRKYDGATLTTMELLDKVFSALIGDQSGKVVDGELVSYKTVRACDLKVFLPKASLIGSGIGLCTKRVFEMERPATQLWSSVLEIHGLKIPTLIGINENERLAKQVVIASVEVEPWISYMDFYNELEEIIVKTIEESTFRTLESLATHVCLRVLKFFILPYFPRGAAVLGEKNIWQSIKVSLEKPTAVTFADAPCVAVSMTSNPEDSAAVKTLWKEKVMTTKPPYPLQGRMEEWISAQMIVESGRKTGGG